MVIEKKNEKGKYIVVEGNRRLAALKALTDPAFQARSPNRHTFEKLAESVVEPLDEIPVVISESREDLVPKLGFRHIAGIMKWESFSKAIYIHSLVLAHLKKELEYDFEAVGSELAIDPSNVKKNYLAYRIYLEARDNDIETKRIEENFGVWYTALGDTKIQKFIGFSPRSTQDAKLKFPISRQKLEALGEFIGYMYGTASVPKVLPESRRIRDLGKILTSKTSLEYLRSGGSFLDALSLVHGEEQTLIKILNKATLKLDESLSYLYKHKKDAKVAIAVQKCTNALVEVLKNFPEIRARLAENLGKGSKC